MTKRKKETLLLLISLVLTAVSWGGFILWQRTHLKKPLALSPEELRPLNPEINRHLLERLKARKKTVADFKIEKPLFERRR